MNIIYIKKKKILPLGILKSFLIKLEYYKMKKSLLFLITTFLSISIFAQSDEEKINSHELGVNATSFIKNFFSLNAADVDEGDYMLTYKKHKNNGALRFGIGGKFSQLNQDIEGGGKLTTKDNFAALRVGYEWKKRVSQKWNIYYGLDAIADYTQTVSRTSTFLITGEVEDININTDVVTAGGGPVLGIQFFISKNITLATEGSLYYRYETTTEKETFDVQTQFNNDETSFASTFDFGLPTALFFTIWF